MVCRKCRAEISDESKFCLYCGAKQTPEKRKAIKRANGTGTVYKLQGRRKRPWAAAKKQSNHRTKTAALEALGCFAGRSLDERYNMTFSEVFQEWKVEHYKELTKSGRAQYDNSFQIFLTYMGKNPRTAYSRFPVSH